MKRLKLFFLSLVCVVPFMTAPSYAVSASDDRGYGVQDPQAPVSIPRYKGDFSDFESVEVLCSSDTSGDYISTALCTLANDVARDKGRDVRLRVYPSGGEERKDSFTLYVRITSAGIAPRATSVRVEASRYYEAAVDREAGYRDPAFFPRRGKLVMFEETITGVGSGDNLEMNLRAHLQAILNRFFARVARDRE